MSPLTRLRIVTVAGGFLAGVLALGAVRVTTNRQARAFAARSAQAIAAYLSLVTPTAKDGTHYDLNQLLIHARALETLPGETPEVEVYHRTAPLVHAMARPLTPVTFDRLRQDETMQERGGVALAPLMDRDGASVVGAVGVRAPRLGPGLAGGWALPALFLMLVSAAGYASTLSRRRRLERQAYVCYVAAALVLGIAAYIDVRSATREAINRWLAATRALVQEAAGVPRRPGLVLLGRLALGGELVAADSSSVESVQRAPGGEAIATLTVRLGPGRWAELRSAADPESADLLLGLVSLALLGPAVAGLAARVSPRG